MISAVQWNDRIRRRLKLRDLNILLAVVQTGSMGKAAGALNMSQPAVSKAIAYLEQTLGVRLLDRSRQGVEPTPYGRALIKRGVAMFDELRQGVEDIAFLNDPTAGEIRIGGSEAVASAIFSPIVEQLSRQHSRISVHAIAGDLQMLSRELDARHIDVVVSRVAGPRPEEHSVEILFEDTLVVVTGLKNPLARRRKIEFADLVDEPWTLQPPDNYFGGLVLEAFHANGIAPPRITIATTSFHLRSELLATGRFLTVVPRFSVMLPHPHPSLKVLPVKFAKTRHPVAIITLKNRSLGPATLFFLDRVRALAKPLAKVK